MFKVNDYFVYSSRGVCCIDDICEKDMGQAKKNYYVFHPVTDSNNKIMTPVDNQKIPMRAIMTKEDASKLLETLKKPNVLDWNPSKKVRDQEFDRMIKAGTVFDHAMLLKLLMTKRENNRSISKKFADTDNRLLCSIQKTLYHELAIVFDSTAIEVDKTVESMILANI